MRLDCARWPTCRPGKALLRSNLTRMLKSDPAPSHRKHAGEKDPEELRQHFLVGYTQLENLEVQGEHLTKIQEGDLSYILGGKHFGG